ncbi:type II toxin-antitoxin system RelE/ParE family toxin [Actinomyces sp. Z3]|nr:type II toxin-antitoxin system RelE/ParE family toxin [Actinomyces sp. Z3]
MQTISSAPARVPVHTSQNHLVFYRIDQAEQVVTVTHIVHGSQDLDSYLD